MSSDLEHWHIDAKVYDDRVEEIHLFSDPARNIRRKPYTKIWHIEQHLGHGSVGEVRLQRNKDEDKVRAVKRVPTSSSILSRKECEHELQALLEFSKPKSKDAAIFVEFLGWFHSGFNIYLAMEYIELGDLETNVQSHSGKLPEVEAQGIAEQILSGLEIMHKASFAHRDLKPQNVLVVVGPPQWWIKLADFGLSKRLTDSTAYRTSAGTRPYMAPEILKYLDFATSGDYTNAVDLWAVGCIIYRLMTGIVPFPPGRSLIQYCEDKSLFPIDSLIKCGVTESGSEFVQQLLAVDPKERLSAANALQHPWITSCANITSTPSNASHPSLEIAELSGSVFSIINYDTASHAGLKSDNSSPFSSTSILSALSSIPPIISLATGSKMADTGYLIPRKSLQQNVIPNSKELIKKGHKASFNKTGAQYEPATIVKRWGNKKWGSAAADDMPVELASDSQQSRFPGTATDLVEGVRFENLKQRPDTVLGTETSETLKIQQRLAITFYDQGQYEKAEEIFKEVVRGQEKVLGKDAPDTLLSKCCLANTLYLQKQYQEAEEIYGEVVHEQEKVLGKEAPNTLLSKNGLANTLYAQKQYQEAKEIYREVVCGREKVLGNSALKTLNSKQSLANTLYAQKQYQEAEEVYRLVVHEQEKVLGKDTLQTLNSKQSLANTLYMQKQYQEAKEIYREVVCGQEKVLGKDSPDTLLSKDGLASTLYAQKQYQEAEEIYREIVRGREKVLGKDALRTLNSKHGLANTLYAQKQYEEAEEIYREVLHRREKVLGKDAPKTLRSRQRLNQILKTRRLLNETSDKS